MKNFLLILFILAAVAIHTICHAEIHCIVSPYGQMDCMPVMDKGDRHEDNSTLTVMPPAPYLMYDRARPYIYQSGETEHERHQRLYRRYQYK
jgi:hypothetical protein